MSILKPTLRQRRTMKILVENKGKSVSSAMIEAGYPPSTAHNPQQLTRSATWKELTAQYLGDDKLAKVHDGLLGAGDLQVRMFEKSLTDEEIKNIVEASGATLKKIVKPTGNKLKKNFNGEKKAYIIVPIHSTRDSALDKAYKLKGRYAPVKGAMGIFNFSKLLDEEDEGNANATPKLDEPNIN